MTKFLGVIEKENKIKFHFLFIPIIKIKSEDLRKKYYFLGLQVFSRKKKSQPKKCGLLDLSNVKNAQIYFDHHYGGGTEVYFFNKLKSKENSSSIIRIQEINNQYKITLFENENFFEMYLDFKSLFEMLGTLKNAQIILNNLVGYQNIFELLKSIKNLKINNNKIISKGHDYFQICPSWNLRSEIDNYCDIPDEKKCQNCFLKNPIISKNYKKQFKTINNWRKMWNDFYQIIDEFVVFSQCSKSLFEKAYPILGSKIQIIPHEVTPFECQLNPNRKNQLPEILNIGAIGNIQFVKGAPLLTEMEQLIQLEKYNKIKITVIGNYDLKNNINVTGEYIREDLPSLVEKHNIDILFIPSIWPETFSYTTQEAIMMGLPVACFDIGAPPERISKYEKGLVISKIEAKTALDEILNWFNI